MPRLLPTGCKVCRVGHCVYFVTVDALRLWGLVGTLVEEMFLAHTTQGLVASGRGVTEPLIAVTLWRVALTVPNLTKMPGRDIVKTPQFVTLQVIEFQVEQGFQSKPSRRDRSRIDRREPQSPEVLDDIVGTIVALTPTLWGTFPMGRNKSALLRDLHGYTW